MLLEKHHPAKTLGNYMRAVGRPKPDECFVAHHIVPGRGTTQVAYEARVDLHFHGIRISDPDNGAWMPRWRCHKGHWAMPECMAHSEIHTYNYEDWVSRLLVNQLSEFAMRSQLNVIQALLRDGKQELYVMLPPSAVKE